jgi:transcriptional regulator with XRE-family HTH domain
MADKVAPIRIRMKEAREARELSQTEVARRMGLHQVDYWRIEAGERRVRLAHVIAFARAVESTVAALFPDYRLQPDEALVVEWARGDATVLLPAAGSPAARAA